MSRPSSSYHAPPQRDPEDDFSLPLFASQQLPSQPQLPTVLHPRLPAAVAAAVAAPPPPGPPRSPQRAAQLPPTTGQYPQQSYSSSSTLTPTSASYLAAAASNGAPPAVAQRQTMHFPAYGAAATSSYPDEIMTSPPMPSSASGALGSLARSASLGTARRKDPFSYPSGDVESGMGGDWSGGYPAGPITHLRPTQQMPQARVNNQPVDRNADVPMSPGSGSRSYGGHQSSQSMPPPPLPSLGRALPSASSPGAISQQLPSQPPSQPPSNPYVPRGVEGGPPPSDSWLGYRRASSHPSPDSVSPLGASPHSPALPVSYGDPSPHLLTPQGTTNNLPGSPRQPYMSSPARETASPHRSAPSAFPSHVHRSQSFAASQPVTPSGRYDPSVPPPHSSSGGQSPSSQGFRPVHSWSDLRPIVNAHPQGRRADPNSSGAYLSPMKCLTQHLPQTYTLCNPTFKYESSDNPRRVLTKPSKPTYNDGADNEDWDYILYVNDVLGGEHGGDRYLILDVLGQGTFGQVVKCQNMRTHAICAVKVVKNKPAYLNQSKMEVAILNLLNNDHDPRDEHHILRMYDSFTHKNHLCLVFECLSSNLYELIKQNQFKGLSLQLVRVFTQQLLECLAVLKDARLIHCDLKPENILLKSLQSPQIKVIDFGSACHELQTVYTYIQSRFYRSPEVLLGLPYSTAIDMWSLGCIVVELFLGLPIFPGTSEYNQVSRIVDMLGLPPQHLLEMGKQTNEFFNFVGVDAQGRKQHKLKPMEQYSSEHRTKEQPSKQYFKQTKLPDIVMEYPYTKKNAKPSDVDKEMGQRRAFINFVEGLLNLDPIKRWSPQQAAKHPFITGEKYTGPFEPPSVPSKRANSTSSITSTSQASPTTPSGSKKYGGLVQSPSANRGQRVYSDAAAYNQQLVQHQYQTAQAQAAQNAVRPGPFSPGYDAQQQQQQQQAYTKPRVVSQHAPPPPSWHQPMGPPAPQQTYHPRLPSGSHAQTLRPNPPPSINAPTIPPPNSYFPASRNRANTINQMDAIPPALARLTNLGAPDPSGNRSSLTPVLHREDMLESWERRQQGGVHKHSSLHNTTYAQLEYLQEQAELVNMGQQGYVMPGQYHGHHGHHVPSASTSISHHRGSQSFSGTQAYQMQPPIGAAQQRDYRPRAPPIQLQATSDYDPPGSTPSSSRTYLPAFPPPVATNQPPAASFDAFDTRDPSLGLMYTPLQPTQAAAGSGQYGYSPGHAARSSFSGPYNTAQAGVRNPFAPGQAPNSPRRYGGSGSGGASYGGA